MKLYAVLFRKAMKIHYVQAGVTFCGLETRKHDIETSQTAVNRYEYPVCPVCQRRYDRAAKFLPEVKLVAFEDRKESTP